MFICAGLCLLSSSHISLFMATTKKVSKSSGKIKKKWNNPNWSLGAVIIGLLGTFLLLVSLLSKPQVEILHHVVVITQGIVAPAVIMGIIFWALIEFFTPPGKSIEDLLIRIIPAFVIGGIFGGLLGYLFNFGGYVLNPAFNGNDDAILFLISVFIGGLAIIWNAAWAHKHGFRGQKTKGSRVITKSESGTSKGARGVLALLIIFTAAIVVVPIGAGMGSLFISGHDNSNVLSSQTNVDYITGSTGPVPFAQVNGTATFDFPSTTANNTTTYSHTVYVETNLTLAELNNFAVSKLVVATSFAGYVNITLGSGTNASNLVPIVSISQKNGTSIPINLSAPMLTGNQSSPVTMEITANTTSMSLSIQVYGNNGLVTIFGPYSVMQTAYLVGTALILAGAFLEVSIYDLNIGRLSKRSPGKGRSTKSGKMGAVGILPFTTTSTSTGQTIFNGIWSVLIGLFQSIATGFGGMFNQMMLGFGQSVVLMFQSFGFSMQGYGVWAPVMFVVGLGMALLVGYLMFTVIDFEKDITGFEADV